MSLRVESKDLHAEFCAIAPDSPLPWTMKCEPAAYTVIIIDANNRAVVKIERSPYEGAVQLAGMILVAVNTCGGFKAEPSP